MTATLCMMPSAESPRSDDPRTRAARTKRDRTRAALLDAADTAFDSRGWSRTRVEDIATAAGVSAATAYNHFATKHVLIGYVYRPLVQPLVVQAERDLAAGRPVTDALVDQLRAVARMTWRRRMLSGAFLAACQEYAAKVRAPARADDPLDPRALAPVAHAVRLIVAAGQASGELRAFPAADDISTMITNMLLLRGVEAPHEPPEVTAELLQTILFGALRPELLLEK